jgi:hypothetical protein
MKKQPTKCACLHGTAAHPAQHCRLGAEADDVSLADGLQAITNALKDGHVLAQLLAGMRLYSAAAAAAGGRPNTAVRLCAWSGCALCA